MLYKVTSVIQKISKFKWWISINSDVLSLAVDNYTYLATTCSIDIYVKKLYFQVRNENNTTNKQ